MEFQKTVSSMYYLWMGEHLEKGARVQILKYEEGVWRDVNIPACWGGGGERDPAGRGQGEAQASQHSGGWGLGL